MGLLDYLLVRIHLLYLVFILERFEILVVVDLSILDTQISFIELINSIKLAPQSHVLNRQLKLLISCARSACLVPASHFLLQLLVILLVILPFLLVFIKEFLVLSDFFN